MTPKYLLKNTGKLARPPVLNEHITSTQQMVSTKPHSFYIILRLRYKSEV